MPYSDNAEIAALQARVAGLENLRGIFCSGLQVDPTYTDNGDGSFTVGDALVALYDNAAFSGYPEVYTVSGNTFTPTENINAILYVDYNSGSPVMALGTAANLNYSSAVPVKGFYRIGTDLNAGAFIKCRGSETKIAIGLSEPSPWTMTTMEPDFTSGAVTIPAGVVFASPEIVTVSSFNSATTATLKEVYHTTAGYTITTGAASFTPTYYDNGTDRVTLTTNQYGVFYVFKDLDGKAYIHYGQNTYLTVTAATSDRFNYSHDVPDLIKFNSVLVGRFIAQKSSTSASETYHTAWQHAYEKAT